MLCPLFTCTLLQIYSVTYMLYPSVLMLYDYDITDEEIVHGLEPWFDLRNDIVGELSLYSCVADNGRGY